MKIKVWLKETAQPMEHEALNAYTKGPLYVVYVDKNTVYKYPLDNIWRIQETY